MTKILHLSDVHFGWPVIPDAIEAIHAACERIAPELVVCSGDFVQRGDFRSQFRAARAFLDRFRMPVLSVPGNHDIPLWNPIHRMLRPFSNYRRYIAQELQPVVRRDDVVVCGISTPRGWLIDLGYVGRAQLDHIERTFRDVPEHVLRVVVMHHPLIPTAYDGWARHHVRGHRRALERLSASRVDVVLCGHSHFPLCVALPPPGGGRALVMAQAGTCASKRFRPHTGCEENVFNVVVREAPGRFAIEHHHLRADGFEEVEVFRFARERETLRPLEP